MTETTYLHFDGLRAPVNLDRAGDLLPLISDVFAKWHYTQDTTPNAEPFVTIRPVTDGTWELVTQDAPASPRKWNAVNVVCDLVAEIAWEKLRSDPSLLCLHAAATDFGGRLVVLPNARRAGKSTLAATLGRLGHKIFTDDFLPVRLGSDAAPFLGLANGVAPRIRMPVPDGFSDGFKQWVARDAGPANRQYKYLLNCPIAASGEAMPIGAVVILDRQDNPCDMSLDGIPAEDALATLISQNFARTLHAGTILRSIDAIAKNLPTFRLTYHCAEAAAQFLTYHDALQRLPAAKGNDAEHKNRPAPLEQLANTGARFEKSVKYRQSAGVIVSEAGETHFLADGNGRSIFQLNAISAIIWTLLEEPIDTGEIVEILTVAFTDADAAQIAADCEGLMENFAAAGLIEPAVAALAAP